MSRLGGESSWQVRALLETERVIAALPPAARARSLARAKASLKAGPVTLDGGPTHAPLGLGWAPVAGLVCLAALAVGAAAYEIGVRTRESPVDREVAGAPELPPDEGTAAPAKASPAAPVTGLRLPERTNPAHEELRLMQHARAAVARQDYRAALELISEHARRFKDGRLSEEREALRVRALTGLGSVGAAQRAAAAFETRFPRSPLRSAVRGMVDAEP